MRPSWFTAIALILCLALMAASCGDDDGSGSASGEQAADGGEPTGGDGSALSGDCPVGGLDAHIMPDPAFDQPDAHLYGSDVVESVAVPLGDSSYTVYLSDASLEGQAGSTETVEAPEGHVVVTLSFQSDDPIEAGDTIEDPTVIIDAGGGAQATTNDPTGSVTVLQEDDSRICFDVSYADGLQVLSGTYEASLVGTE